MKQRQKKPDIPRPAEDTVRQAIAHLLATGPHSARELSAAVHISEREVYGHLEHIRKSVHLHGAVLEVVPARCKRCGFTFVKRDRLSSPGKCPVCRHEAISAPQFSLRSVS